MKKCLALFFASLALCQAAAADAGTVGGGGGPPPAMIAIKREDFLSVYNAIARHQEAVNLVIQGRTIRAERFDFPRQQIRGKDMETGQNMALTPVFIPEEFLKENAGSIELPSVEIIE